jgi:O-antigen/teichoic acid export membrane protein
METEVTLGDVDLATVKARSLTGIVTLISRSFVIQIVSTLGFFLLSVFLQRPEIGLFIAVNEMVSILGYFSDVGLAASLIQKKDKVSLADLRTTFTLQQILVLFLLTLTLTLTPVISGYYHISGSGIWLMYSLLVAFFLASLKTIPSVILERQLRFEILAFIEIIENLIFYVVAVLLAWSGRGVESYAWAILLRGLIGTSLIYYLAPWKIGFQISLLSLKTLLSFGIPYQINSLMAVIKDRFLNIFLWKIIGADGVGIIGWAQTWSQKPLRFIMDNVTKVTFPGFSRLQDHPEELKRGIEKTLFYISLITFPVVGGMAVLAPFVIQLIPKYSKWEVALIPLALFCLNSAWAAVSTPLTNTLNALGKVKINSYLMVMWTLLAWVLTPYLAVKYGYIGVAYASAIISFTSIVPVLIIKKLTHFNLSSVIKPAIAASAMISVSYFLSLSLTLTLPNIIINIVISGLIYSAAIFLLVGPSLITDAKKILVVFKRK